MGTMGCGPVDWLVGFAFLTCGGLALALLAVAVYAYREGGRRCDTD
jgi:hypothetical protein